MSEKAVEEGWLPIEGPQRAFLLCGAKRRAESTSDFPHMVLIARLTTLLFKESRPVRPRVSAIPNSHLLGARNREFCEPRTRLWPWSAGRPTGCFMTIYTKADLDRIEAMIELYQMANRHLDARLAEFDREIHARVAHDLLQMDAERRERTSSGTKSH